MFRSEWQNYGLNGQIADNIGDKLIGLDFKQKKHRPFEGRCSLL